MPDTFDEQEYKRKLIAGAVGDAAALAARTAAARRESGSTGQEAKPAGKEKPAKKAGAAPGRSAFKPVGELFELTPPAQPAEPPAPATAERRQTFIEAVAQHVGTAWPAKGRVTL